MALGDLEADKELAELDVAMFSRAPEEALRTTLQFFRCAWAVQATCYACLQLACPCLDAQTTAYEPALSAAGAVLLRQFLACLSRRCPSDTCVLGWRSSHAMVLQAPVRLFAASDLVSALQRAVWRHRGVPGQHRLPESRAGAAGCQPVSTLVTL